MEYPEEIKQIDFKSFVVKLIAILMIIVLIIWPIAMFI